MNTLYVKNVWGNITNEGERQQGERPTLAYQIITGRVFASLLLQLSFLVTQLSNSCIFVTFSN
jgi:hypothetical protein